MKSSTCELLLEVMMSLSLSNFQYFMHAVFKTKIRVETRNPSHLSIALIFSNLLRLLIL